MRSKKSKGYYKSRSDKIKNSLEVRYFEPEVLDKYRNNPSLELGLQQYMWGKKADGSPCIAVLLKHISYLKPKEQMYWRSFELDKKDLKQAKIEARYYKPMIQGGFPDVLPSFDVVLPTLQFINKITSPDILFREVPKDEPSFLQPITKNSKKEYLNYILELDKLTSTNINTEYLLKKIKTSGKDNMLKKGETLNLLGTWLEELGVIKEEIDECLKPLKTVRKQRQEKAHKLFEDSSDKDYILKQKQITLEVWEALYKIAQWLKSALDVNNSIEESRLLTDFRII